MESVRKSIKALLAALCIFVIQTVVLAALVMFTPFKEDWTYLGLIFVMSTACLLFGFFTGNIIGKKGILTGALAAIILLILITICVDLAYKEPVKLVLDNIFMLIPIISGAIGGILGTNKDK